VALERLVVSHAAKMNTDPEHPVLVEPNVLVEAGSEVVAELEPEPEADIAAKPEPETVVVDEPEPEAKIEESLVETAKLAIELVPSTPAVRVPVILRSPDLYDPLQIFL